MKKMLLIALTSLIALTGCQSEQEIVTDFNGGKEVLCQNSIQTPVMITNKDWSYSSEFKKFYKENKTFSLTQCESKGN